MNGVWLVTDGKDWVRPMEHEGDYEDGDTLLNVTVGIGGVMVRYVPTKKEGTNGDDLRT